MTIGCARELYAMRHPYATNRARHRQRYARHPRWYRGSTVRGRQSLSDGVLARRLRRARVAAARRGLRRRLARTRTNRGTFTLQVVSASFPAKQSIARPRALTLEVRNTGAHTVPNVAVTLDSFYYTATIPNWPPTSARSGSSNTGPGAIASPPVPSEAVSPPGGGQTAYVNTWALGPLAPGQHTARSSGR